MKRSTFLQAALFGMGISLVAGILFHLFTVLFSTDLTVRCLIAGAGFIAVIQLIRASGEPVGLVTAVTLWTLMSIVLVWLEPPLVWYLSCHIAFIWITRSVYFYSSVFASMIDLSLCVLSFCAAAWTAVHTGNVFLSFWSFYLVQALHGSIPLSFDTSKTQIPETDTRFEQAYRDAQTALGRLSSMQ